MKPRIVSYYPQGWTGRLIKVEVDIRRGLPAFDIIGLAGSAVKEARERVRTACLRSGFDFPNDHILINLYPADLAKEGTSYDLALALAVLVEAGNGLLGNSERGEEILVLGELGLKGEVCPAKGVLAALMTASDFGVRFAIVPLANRDEARLADANISIAYLANLSDLAFCSVDDSRLPLSLVQNKTSSLASFLRLRGQDLYKQALVVCAAGMHHLMVCGPPGTGKTMGARILSELWPSPGPRLEREIFRMQSLAGYTNSRKGDFSFRTPHHSSSVQAILGGGKPLGPGEISLAHGGVLVLDEALQFQTPVIQGLREPLESGWIHLSRASEKTSFPARATLCLTMNPCPCGNLGKAGSVCLCSMPDVMRYWAKLGAPVIDRLDLHINLLDTFETSGTCLSQLVASEDAGQILFRIERARELQYARWGEGGCNGWTLVEDVRLEDYLGPALVQAAWEIVQEKKASIRTWQALLRLCLTIADLCEAKPDLNHLHSASLLRFSGPLCKGLTIF